MQIPRRFTGPAYAARLLLFDDFRLLLDRLRLNNRTTDNQLVTSLLADTTVLATHKNAVNMYNRFIKRIDAGVNRDHKLT